jgi:GT2 family glycosyltransferase
MILSIIIPNYNGKSLLRGCLNSIYVHPPTGKYEIIVVDNASEDESQEIVKKEFPKVFLISNPQNKGFSYAVNRGIERSRGKYILLLNNDTLVIDNSLDLMVQFMDQNPHVDICGPNLLWKDMTLQRSAQTFPTLFREFLHANPILKKIYKGEGSLSHKFLFFFLNLFKTEWASFIDYSKTREVDVVTGAAFMFRRSCKHEIGLLDENYFMYSEEADYCYRIRKAGGKVYYYPEAHIIHFLGQTSKQEFKKGDWIPNDMLIERYKSMLYFFKKHYNQGRLCFLRLIIIEAYLMRLGINCLKYLFSVSKREEIKKNINIYKTIIKLAIHYS